MSAILPKQRVWFRLPLAVALIAATALAVQATPGSAAPAPVNGATPAARADSVAPTAPVNKNPAFVHIYSANVENLAGRCPKSNDWQNLIHYMNLYDNLGARTTPDIFVVEQINNPQLASLLSYMSTQLRGKYNGRMATTDLKGGINHPPCAAKKHQGNAIIWRTGRFEALHHGTWQSLRSKSGASCQPSTQVRTINEVIKFRDKAGAKDRFFSVSSMHLPTHTLGGAPCAAKNVKRAHRALKAENFGGSLRVIAGDSNIHDVDGANVSRPWYTAIRGGKLNYADAISHACASSRTCLDANWTIKPLNQKNYYRYDYIFARQGKQLEARTLVAHTITFGEASAVAGSSAGVYSLHRALHTRVYYPTG